MRYFIAVMHNILWNQYCPLAMKTWYTQNQSMTHISIISRVCFIMSAIFYTLLFHFIFCFIAQTRTNWMYPSPRCTALSLQLIMIHASTHALLLLLIKHIKHSHTSIFPHHDKSHTVGSAWASSNYCYMIKLADRHQKAKPKLFPLSVHIWLWWLLTFWLLDIGACKWKKSTVKFNPVLIFFLISQIKPLHP